MRYDRGMGRRTGGAVAVRGNLDGVLRRLVPLALLVLILNGLPFALAGAPGVGDVAHLRAIALPIGRLLGWIAGTPAPDLVPAPLRSAPLPLLVDWLIWRALPFGMAGLRLVHLLLAAAALGLLLRALSMRMDLRTAVVAGFAIALSPRIVEPITNLGPDPFVISLFCVQLAMLLTRGKIGGPAPLASFGASAAASGLCGVTGMIASASLLAMLLFAAPDRRDLWRRLRVSLLVLLVWAFPLAIQLGAGRDDAMSSIGLARLGTKLVAHNADLLLIPGAALLAAGTAVLILLGTYSYGERLLRNGPSERTHPFALLLLATAVGGALVLVAGPLLRLYVWIEPPAQAWLALLLILLAAACFTPRLVVATDGLRRLRRFGTAMMIAGALIGTIAFQYRADWFAAGPETGLGRALEAAGRDHAIVYAGGDWGRAYFPHAWLMPQDDDQWLLAFDGTMVQRVLPGGQLGPSQPLAALDGYGALVIARIDRRGWRDLNAVTNTQAIGALPPAPLDGFSKAWIAEPAQAAPGEYWLTTQLLRKSG